MLMATSKQKKACIVSFAFLHLIPRVVGIRRSYPAMSYRKLRMMWTLRSRTEDLKIDTYRASGAGGQHINTTDSAVRITHLPSGIVVTCQNERSQIKNREQAMTMLRSKLYERKIEEQRQQLDEIRGEQSDIAWGSQIRSYVFHPYSMVKDHRTSVETGNVGAVMDGDLDPFIDGYLRSQIKLDAE